MLKKVLISGVTAAAIVGAGGVALATTGDGSGGGSSATQRSAAQHGTAARHGKDAHRRARRLLRHLDHATIVRDTRKRGDVTLRLIRGTVTAVSPSSITVVSADRTSETFKVTGMTKVHSRADGKRTASSIGKVASGDHVFAAAVGATEPVARRILDVGTK